ncbi:tagaturonate reductase [Clostridiales bacterium COT073_COT-073]|nr:tagaturonate reductase [Clostridiales bacterium COT073_COT-073]
MKKLSYQTLKEVNYGGYLLEQAPERVLQFGEGNFLRAFTDYFIDVINEKAGFQSKVVVVQPIAGGDKIREFINQQEGLYTLILRGNENGRKVSETRVISCVSRCLNPYSQYDTYMACADNPDLRFIVCNTTEAGIQYDPGCQFSDRPAGSYPAKLTQFLYARFQKFGAQKGKGFIILACELIDDNGKELEKCVLQYARQWQLPSEFIDWIQTENVFCSTLVDRIVTGYPHKEADQICENLRYQDNVLDTGEIFAFWVIEGPEWLKRELPFAEAGLPVLITADHKPYKQRKVRILNGAHTSMVLGAYLAGQNIVRDCMQDPVIREFMERTIYDEIIPTLSLPEKELVDFAKAVTDRFENPFIDHALLSISLNSTAKWKARVLPSLKGYVDKFGRLPIRITASLAFYLAFYHGVRQAENGLIGLRGTEEYLIQDDRSILDFYYHHKDRDVLTLVQAALANSDFWGEDLTKIKGLAEEVGRNLQVIKEQGAYQLLLQCRDRAAD